MSGDQSLRLGAHQLADGRGALRLLTTPPLCIADVLPRSAATDGPLTAYLETKSRYAAATGSFSHAVLEPGPALWPALRDVRPDVVLVHGFHGERPDALAAARASGARVVAVPRGRPAAGAVVASAVRARLRDGRRQVDAVLAPGGLPRRDGYPHAPKIRLHVGVREAFRPQPGVRRGDATVLVGDLARHADARAVLEIAAGDGPPVTHVSATWDPDHLALLYASARCVVVTGDSDGFDPSALEAAACGAPVVTPLSAPSAAALGDLGHLYVAGDADDLAAAIGAARAATPDPALALALGRSHDWSRVLEAERAALADLVGQRGQTPLSFSGAQR